MITTKEADDIKAKQVRRIVIKWIDEILNRKMWSGTDLARHSGLAASTVLRILNDKEHRFIPSMKTLSKIATGSGTPVSPEVIDVLSAMRYDLDYTAGEASPRTPANQATIARAKKMPVRHTSSLPSALHANSDRGDIAISVPEQFDGDDTAFAFYNPDAKLEPWFKAGMLMYATKRRDPIAGDWIFVTDGSGRSKVRLLLEINESGIVLSESMPAKADDTMGFDDIKDLAVVGLASKL